MALTSASTLNYLQWSQQRENPGFNPTIQGPDTLNFGNTFTVEDTGVNTIYAVEATLAALGSTTIDLQSLTDFFNDPIVFTRVYAVQVEVTGASMQMGPGAVYPVDLFFLSPSDRIVIQDGDNFMYSGIYPFAVTSIAKTLDLYNESSTVELTYRISIIGGQGAGTTSTTSTTATTVSSSTTAAVTSSTSTT